MGDKTGIEWTDATWNPVTGCSKVSPGCAHCYAERLAPRTFGPGRAFTDVRFHEDRLFQPLRWRRPRLVFVNSMSDLFHEDVTDGQIARILSVMYEAHRHVFQVLTKRPVRMREFLTRWADVEGEGEPLMVDGPAAVRAAHPSGRGQLFAELLEAMGEPPPGARFPMFDWMGGPRWWLLAPWNVWWGVSVETQKAAQARLPELAAVPGAVPVRFVSVEPLLGEVDLTEWLEAGDLQWVIVGGESGPGARPIDPAWVRRIRDDCGAAGVPFFFKQWGGIRKADNGRLLDGMTHDEMPAGWWGQQGAPGLLRTAP